MFASLKGTLQERSPRRIVVEVRGVGYQVKVPLSTYGVLPEVGSEVFLLIHTQVRESELSLYGFATPEEQTLFERMISVSGVGPRIAMSLLSGLPPEELVEAVKGGRSERLCAVPGVGRRTAERIVVDLRDKLQLRSEEEEVAGPLASARGNEKVLVTDVVSALTNLGYPGRDAERVVAETWKQGSTSKGGRKTLTFQDLLRETLKRMLDSR